MSAVTEIILFLFRAWLMLMGFILTRTTEMLLKTSQCSWPFWTHEQPADARKPMDANGAAERRAGRAYGAWILGWWDLLCASVGPHS